MKKLMALALVCCSVFASIPAPAAEVVTSCGQTVEGAARLDGDLDCSSAADASIRLVDGSLDLRGHVIVGNVFCTQVTDQPGNCVISGPGTIRGCVMGFYSVVLRGVTVSYEAGMCTDETTKAGVSAKNVKVYDSQISGPDGCVVADGSSRGRGNVTLVHSTLKDCCSDLNDPGCANPLALAALGRARIVDSTIEGGLIAGRSASLRKTNVLLTNNFRLGLEMREKANRVLLVDSSITGSNEAGIRGNQVRLEGSSVTSNCIDHKDFFPCADLVTDSLKLVGSSCGSSLCADGLPCGGCAGD